MSRHAVRVLCRGSLVVHRSAAGAGGLLSFSAPLLLSSPLRSALSFASATSASGRCGAALAAVSAAARAVLSVYAVDTLDDT